MTSIVWFKKDLRVQDHRPLVEAATRGDVIPLFIYEPAILTSPEFERQHLRFLNQSLEELGRALRRLGASLIVREGDAVSVLESIRAATSATALFSHEETGNELTYARDRAVAAWARATGVVWTEYPQNGVVRRLKNRDGWSRTWDARMSEPLIPPPIGLRTPSCVKSGPQLEETDGRVQGSSKVTQPGGESAAHRTLEDFLSARGVAYAKGLSSPVSAPTACSRLSAHLSFGTISMKQIAQALVRRQEQLRTEPSPESRRWGSSLRAFEARLHWHCHFMQKLESEPRIEFENMHRACDGLREDDFSEERFHAWCEGRTGYPMVDACMRSLLATGWLNFRMRAMLVSFAAYDLWLHWRRPAVFLARHFLDFEAGIHFPQFQMQSGTTGINALRMYSPTKQGLDHDPHGEFIRRWVPELEAVPSEHVHEPWLMPHSVQVTSGCIVGRNYPAPVVDHRTVVAAAKQKLYGLRRQEEARSESRAIVRAHGSRKGSARKPQRTVVAADLFDTAGGEE